jgi:hypothetical protein
MSFLDPKPLTPGALDAAAAALAAIPASDLAGELSATYVTFVDSVTGLPLVGKHVIITVDQTTDDIADITVEEI